MGFYKWLYTHLTPWIKRPWTFFIRDLWNEAEWVMQTFWVAVGVILGYFFNWEVIVIAWAIYTFGYVNGHLFWGTKWIKGQKGG